MSSILFVLAAIMVAVSAPPALPYSPYGVVAPSVPDGTVVEALCGGVSQRQTTTTTYEGASWYYNLDIPADDPETAAVDGCVAGDTVRFRIGKVLCPETATWVSGGGGRLDLTAMQPSAIALTTFGATSGAACWRGIVIQVSSRPGGYWLWIAPVRGGLARTFFSVRKFWPTQRVTVCGSFVK